MFDRERIYISEIQSIIYVKPTMQNKKRIYYGPTLRKYELIYKISGESYTTFNGITMHNIAGTVEFLPKCENSEYYVDRIEPGDCIDIFFDTDCPLPTEAFAINCSKSKKIGDLFDKIYRIWIYKEEGYYFKCMSLFYEILAEVTKRYNNYIPNNKFKIIEKGVEYLHTHCFDKHIDYYKSASLCEISYTYFKTLFKQKFGIPPVQYITKLRLERAIELLETGRYNISEIAEMCGFENVFYFSRRFKEKYGVSPKNYNYT